MSLISALSMIGGRLKPWDAIVSALLDGHLPFHLEAGAKPIIARVLVRRADLVPIASALGVPVNAGSVGTGRMTKRDAGEVLNIGPLAQTAFFRRHPAGHEKTISVAQVRAIAEEQISSAEISARTGWSPSKVHSWAGKAAIERMSEAGYPRETVEGLLPQASSGEPLSDAAAGSKRPVRSQSHRQNSRSRLRKHLTGRVRGRDRRASRRDQDPVENRRRHPDASSTSE